MELSWAELTERRRTEVGDFTAAAKLKLLVSSTDQTAVPLNDAGMLTVPVSCSSRLLLKTPLAATLEDTVTTGDKEGRTVTVTTVSADLASAASKRNNVT